jgi:hypothetical protein
MKRKGGERNYTAGRQEISLSLLSCLPFFSCLSASPFSLERGGRVERRQTEISRGVVDKTRTRDTGGRIQTSPTTSPTTCQEVYANVQICLDLDL